MFGPLKFGCVSDWMRIGWPTGRGVRRERAGGNEPLLAGVHYRVEAFERSRSQETQVSWFGKNDLIHGLELAARDDGNAHVPCGRLAVGHDERLVLLENLDTCRVQLRFRQPRDFRAAIHEDLLELNPFRPPGRFAEAGIHREDTHSAQLLPITL